MDALTMHSLQSSPHTPEKNYESRKEKEKRKIPTLENDGLVYVQDVKGPRRSTEFEKYPAQGVSENTNRIGVVGMPHSQSRLSAEFAPVRNR
jgi:hypothetical protein